MCLTAAYTLIGIETQKPNTILLQAALRPKKTDRDPAVSSSGREQAESRLAATKTAAVGRREEAAICERQGREGDRVIEDMAPKKNIT